MKQLEYLYFNIYNHCYQRSERSGDFVRFQAMYLVSLSAGGWILFLQAIYLRMIKQSWFTSKSGAMLFAISVYLLSVLVFHRILITEERDHKIFNKYESSWDRNRNKTRDLLFSAFVIIVPYALLTSLSIFYPRQR